MACGEEGAGAVGGSGSVLAIVGGGLWVVGCALCDGGMGSVRAGGVETSSGEASLSRLGAAAAAGEGSREMGKLINVGSGP